MSDDIDLDWFSEGVAEVDAEDRLLVRNAAMTRVLSYLAAGAAPTLRSLPLLNHDRDRLALGTAPGIETGGAVGEECEGRVIVGGDDIEIAIRDLQAEGHGIIHRRGLRRIDDDEPGGRRQRVDDDVTHDAGDLAQLGAEALRACDLAQSDLRLYQAATIGVASGRCHGLAHPSG